MIIPIQNIYYLLCYAWNKLEERDTVSVQALEENKVINLLSRVLIAGMNHLFKRGLDRGYCLYEEESKRVKGKIDFSTTIKKNMLCKSQVHCHYDELSYNVLHNQILKTTIGQLININDIDHSLRHELVSTYKKLNDISEIRLTNKVFSDVQLNQSNFFYDFLLKICELILDNLLISEDEGGSKFTDFIQNERQMAYLFETFVRNFYKKEQQYFKVKRESVPWLATPLDKTSADYLPKMQTDISLTSSDRHIVIDTKFYKESLQYHHGKPTIHSGHLYQINSYLNNLDKPVGDKVNYEGILLYPTVKEELDLVYDFQGKKITVTTINLNQDWKGIHGDLLNLIN